MSGRVAEPARVRFYRAPDRELFVVEVDLPRHEQQRSLDRFVRELRLRIVHGEQQTRRQRRICRLYVKEQDGTPVTDARQLEIQTRLLAEMLVPEPRRRERMQSWVD
jgi:hypothetical protein